MTVFEDKLRVVGASGLDPTQIVAAQLILIYQEYDDELLRLGLGSIREMTLDEVLATVRDGRVVRHATLERWLYPPVHPVRHATLERWLYPRGRPPIAQALEEQIRAALAVPGRPGVRVIARKFGITAGTVQRVARTPAPTT
jgi:hypothetical protein